MQKIVLTFGLIAGAMLSGVMLLAELFKDQIGFDHGLLIGYTSMVLAFLMVFFGIKSYRDNQPGGQVTFGRAFKVGLLITLIASACYVATWQLVYFKLDPTFMEKEANYSMEKARKAGATQAKIDSIQAYNAKIKLIEDNPLTNIPMTFIEPLPVGLLFTLVAAGVLSRKRRGATTAVA